MGEPREEAPGAPLNRGELQDRAVRGVTWTLIHTVVSLPLAFLTNLALARVLGVVDYGRLAFLSALMDIAGAIVALGIGFGITQFGAKAHAAGRREAVRDLLQKSQGFRLFFSAPIVSVLVLVVVDVPTPLLIVAIVFGVWLPSALSGARACLGIENKTAQGAQLAMAENLLTQAAVVVVVFTVATSDAVWSVRLIVSGLFAVAALYPISRDYRAAVLRPRVPRGFPAGFWRYSIPTGAAGIVGVLVVSRSEVLVLQAISTPVAVGTFSLAFGLASHVFAPAQAIIGPLIPAVSGLREVDEHSVGRALARTVRASSAVVALLVSSALPAFAALVPALYGEEYGDAPQMLMVLGAVGGLLILGQPVQAFIHARLRGAVILRINLIALAVNIALAFALIPLLGAWGAVLANAGAGLTRLVLFFVNEIRATPGVARDVLTAAWPVGFGILAAGLGWFVTQVTPGPVVLAAAAGGVAGLLALAGLIRLARSGLTAGDRDAIVRTLPARLRPVGAGMLSVISHRQGA